MNKCVRFSELNRLLIFSYKMFILISNLCWERSGSISGRVLDLRPRGCGSELDLFIFVKIVYHCNIYLYHI